MTEEKHHSIYSPSKLERIILCPGSIPLEQALGLPPKNSNPDADHGTVLHDYIHDFTTDPKSNARVLSIEDQCLINDSLDYYYALLNSLDNDQYKVYSEVKVSLLQWGLPDVYGTADKVIIDRLNQHMHILDWKFGFIMVLARMNPQEMAYAAGSLTLPTYIEKVTLHIVQPKIDNYSHWTTDLLGLSNWVHGTLAPAINECKYGTPKFNPGEKQCQWCPCKNHCDDRCSATK